MRRRCFSPIQSWRRFAIDDLEPRQLFSAPPLPVIPAGVFNITAYGATTALANNATAIQAAITAATSAGGGTVEVPAGTFMSGPISLASKINLQIDSGAMLKALSMANYPNNTAPSNFISIVAKNNVEISGSGTIDGNGADWWAAYNASGGTISRPRLINGNSSGGTVNNILWIRNVTLQNSPQFNMALSGSNNVTVDGITIFNPTSPTSNISPNTDGIDMGGSHWLIENSTIDTGDDNIVAKPGSTVCSDMTVTNCIFKHGHGMSIGGQTNLGLNGLTVTNCTFDGTTTGIRMKAGRLNPDGGGLVQNCTYSNITMYNVQYPININSYYPDTIPSAGPQDPAQPITATTPYWQNITISNMTSVWDSSRASYSSSIQSSSYCGIIWGLPEAPVLNLAMTNVKISGAKFGIDLNHVRNVSFDTQCSFTPTSGNNLISTKTAPTPYDALIVKAGWTDTDIGTPLPVTTTVYNPNVDVQSLIAGGSGFTGTSDQFNLESQDITGNALVSTEVGSLATTNAGGLAGVMLRDGTAAGAAFAAAVQQTNKQIVFLYRSSTNAAVQASAAVGDTSSVKYVKVTRVGDTFSGFYSTNGTTWTAIASPVTISMSATLKAGLAETSATTSSATSAAFVGATVINDNTAPTLTSDAYLYSTSLNKLSFSFSEDVSASLSTSSLGVITVPGDGSSGSPVNVTAMSFDGATNTATFTLATPLANGNYMATLSGASTTDLVGNPLVGGDVPLPFFVLPGDINRDGVVNALDFNSLATHFGQAGGFAAGDLDFNGTINTADFTILGTNFGTNVAPPSASALGFRPASPGLFADGPAFGASVTLADEIVDPLALAGSTL